MYRPCSLNSFEKLRAVAATREQQRHLVHFAFLTDRAYREIYSTDSEQLFLPGLRHDLFFGDGFFPSKNFSTYGDVVFAVSVGQQTEVTYPDKASRQDMKQEPSNKFIGLEGHGFLLVMVGIISPEEGNPAVLEGEEAVIADGDSVSLSAEVLKDPLGAIEGRFAIDDPLLAVERSLKGLEVSRIFEMTETVGKKEIPFLEGMIEEVKELASEQGRQDPYGEEKPFPGRYPAVPVRGQATPGDDTVEVGMAHKVLTPGMENADHPYRGPEMFRSLGQFRERLGGEAKKQIVQDLLVH